MRQLLDEAARGGYGVGAFNVNNMEQIQGIMEATRETCVHLGCESASLAAASADRFGAKLQLVDSECRCQILPGFVVERTPVAVARIAVTRLPGRHGAQRR
jgi:fructose-bisphosphate aldolase class II